jgi:hypothetical protein
MLGAFLASVVLQIRLGAVAPFQCVIGFSRRVRMARKLVKIELAMEKRVRDFAATLSEKDRRRFAALEATRRGRGGIAYVASLIGCSTKTIERGIQELDQLANDPAAGRVRRHGAGRKFKMDSESPLTNHLKPGLDIRTNGERGPARRRSNSPASAFAGKELDWQAALPPCEVHSPDGQPTLRY